MANKKEIVEESVEVTETPKKTESEAKAKRRAYFDAYKLKNPVKYELKKAAFEAELAKMD